MAKKRRKRVEGPTESGGQRDSLGKLIKEYRVTLLAVLLVSGVIGAIGLGIVGYALTRDPISPGFLIVGGATVLASGALLIMNIFNVGRRLELRKRGIRFTESGSSTEFFWDEIVDIEVSRTESTNVGVGTVHTRSSDAVSPSSVLSKSEWDVTIHSDDGRSIHLSPIFMQMVPDPKELISHLRMRAGTP